MLARLIATFAYVSFAQSQQNIVSIGLQLPLSDPVACVSGWHYLHVARSAVRFIQSTPWWTATGAALRLELLPSGGPGPLGGGSFMSWQSAVTYALGPTPSCPGATPAAPCSVLRAGIVGPFDLDASRLVMLVTRLAKMLHLSYAATDDSLTQDDYSPMISSAWQPFLRGTHTDTMAIGALYAFIRSQGWQMVTIFFSRTDSHAAAQADLLSGLIQQNADSTGMSVWATIPYDASNTAYIDTALRGYAADVSRVAVLMASSVDAAPLLVRAEQLGITGKGWTWLGTEWVREFTWVVASMPSMTNLLNLTYAEAAAAATPSPAPINTGGGERRNLAAEFNAMTKATAASPTESDVVSMSAISDLPNPSSSENSRARMVKHAAAVVAAEAAAAHLLGSSASRRRLSSGGSMSPGSAFQPAAHGPSYIGPNNVLSVQAAMAGAVGVVPFRVPPHSALGGYLDRFFPYQVSDTSFMMLSAPGAFPLPVLPSPAQCWLFNNAPVTTEGLPLDLFGAYVFDAIFDVAAGVAEALGAGPGDVALLESWPGGASHQPFANLTSEAIATALLAPKGTGAPSLLTGQTAVWLANGDRYNVPLSLVNVQGTTVVTAALWTSAVAPAPPGSNATGVTAPGVLLTDGIWAAPPGSVESGGGGMTLVWPGGVARPPPDRALDVNGTNATALVVALLGVVLALLLGAVVRHAGLVALPATGVSVLVGASAGILLRFAFGAAVQATAELSHTTFLLVLLPIIIVQSGYALDKRAFFSQLFSIVTLAIVGTLVSSALTGYLIWWAGARGAIASLAGEESAAFGALLAATDPFAIASVYSSLFAHPVLAALLYGEALLNDAVAIVLYRSFAGFLVADVTSNAAVLAAGAFIGILFFSVLLGVSVGMCATLAFRYVNISGQNRNVRWEKEFKSHVLALRRLMPSLPAAGGMVGSGRLGAVIDDTSSTDGDGEAAPFTTQNDFGSPAESKTSTADGLDRMAGVAETAILLLFGYVSFTLAEALGLSGVVAALLAGVTMNMYTRRVLTRDGQAASIAVFHMLAELAETTVFFQVGLNVVLTFDVNAFNVGFVAVTLFACLVSRAVAVASLSWLLNQWRREPLPRGFQLVLWWSGLRGAIAYSTALGFPSQNRPLIVNTTAWVCLFTLFALGGSATAVLRFAGVPTGVNCDAFWRAQSAADAAELAAERVAADVSSTAATAPARYDNTFSKAQAERKAKVFLVLLDRWIQRFVYSRRFLREMEAANAVAALRARRRIMDALDMPFPDHLAAQLREQEAWLADDARDEREEDSEEDFVEEVKVVAAAATSGESTSALSVHGCKIPNQCLRNPAVNRPGDEPHVDDADSSYFGEVYAIQKAANAAAFARARCSVSHSSNSMPPSSSFSAPPPLLSATPFAALHDFVRPGAFGVGSAAVNACMPSRQADRVDVGVLALPMARGDTCVTTASVTPTHNSASASEVEPVGFTGATPWQGSTGSAQVPQVADHSPPIADISIHTSAREICCAMSMDDLSSPHPHDGAASGGISTVPRSAASEEACTPDATSAIGGDVHLSFDSASVKAADLVS